MIASRLLALAAVILCTTGQLVAQEQVRSPNPLASLDQATLKAFVEQPLFELSRRQPVVAPPYVYVAPPVPTFIEQPPSLRLLGLVESTRSIFAVVYRIDKGIRPETLRPGESHRQLGGSDHGRQPPSDQRRPGPSNTGSLEAASHKARWRCRCCRLRSSSLRSPRATQRCRRDELRDLLCRRHASVTQMTNVDAISKSPTVPLRGAGRAYRPCNSREV